MAKIVTEGLAFDDVLIKPRFAKILPQEVDTSSFFSRNIKLSVPFVSSPMDTVTEHSLAIAMASSGGIGLIHRKMSIGAEALEVKKVKDFKPDKDGFLLVGAAVGAVGDFLERAQELGRCGADVIVIDSSHGHSRNVLNALLALKKSLTIDVVVGNIATKEAALMLLANGADGLRVGIGPGSICTTRIVAGCGVPQITAIMEVAEAAGGQVPIIADGGIKYSGDIVKAIAAGADTVMMGSLFAGTDESPGGRVTFQGREYKVYRGMGSEGVLGEGSDRYGAKAVAEGVEGLMLNRGALAKVFSQLEGGLRQGMGYAGCKDIHELQDFTQFYKMTGAGLAESHPHGILITEEPANYPILSQKQEGGPK